MWLVGWVANTFYVKKKTFLAHGRLEDIERLKLWRVTIVLGVVVLFIFLDVDEEEGGLFRVDLK